MVNFNQATNDYAMPVILEFEEKLLRDRMPSFVYTFNEGVLADRIKAGLRATLQTESLVTGILYVGLDVDPKAPPPVFHQLEKRYLEVPSVPTKTQQLLNNLASLDVKSIETNLNGLITKLDGTVGRLNMVQINQGVTNLLLSLDRLVTSPEITNDLAAIRATLDQYRLLGEKLNNRIDPLVDSITNSLMEANRTLAQLRGAAENLKSTLAPDSPVRNGLDLALQQLSGTLQSLSELLDLLKQHPNALITGREIPKAKP